MFQIPKSLMYSKYFCEMKILANNYFKMPRSRSYLSKLLSVTELFLVRTMPAHEKAV